MVNSDIIGYAETLLQYQWDYLFDIDAGSYTNDSGSSVSVTTTLFMGYTAAGFAILLSLLGALDNAGETIYYVESSLDTWLETFGSGVFDGLSGDSKDTMVAFLTTFTLNMITYALALFGHSIFLIAVGFFYGWWAMNRTPDLADTYEGFRLLLFGILIGTTTYFSGNATKNSVESVMLSMGFEEHEYEEGTTITTTVESYTGVTTTTTTGGDDAEVIYDYSKLIDMQENWSAFFTLQRGLQMATPYMFLICIEVAVAGITTLAVLYSTNSSS